jgi:hypothetical protein
MKKYSYVEFIDGTFYSIGKTGKLHIVSKNPESYIGEFELIEETSREGKRYYTTLEKIGEKGWELIFVTPCGNLRENGGEMLQNAYIFKKEIEV